jgi:hypothetical protein
MAKEPTVISITELQRRLRLAERTYGSGAKITLTEDLSIEPYNRPDLSEETPEESAKRAERQRKEALETPKQEIASRITRPIEALKADIAPKTVEARAKKDESKRQA